MIFRIFICENKKNKNIGHLAVRQTWGARQSDQNRSLKQDLCCALRWVHGKGTTLCRAFHVRHSKGRRMPSQGRGGFSCFLFPRAIMNAWQKVFAVRA
jgi:hypothetical protein